MNKTRPKQLSFRVSEEEYRQLQEKILESGKNQQEYILSCVLEKQIVNTDGIKELIPELKRIGNNLNQIAKGKSVWTITYGCIQFAVWDYFIYLFVLWGDDYISWNDNADGNFCLNIMAEESV